MDHSTDSEMTMHTFSIHANQLQSLRYPDHFPVSYACECVLHVQRFFLYYVHKPESCLWTRPETAVYYSYIHVYSRALIRYFFSCTISIRTYSYAESNFKKVATYIYSGEHNEGYTLGLLLGSC